MDTVDVLVRFIELYADIPAKTFSGDCRGLEALEKEVCVFPEHQLFFTRAYLCEFIKKHGEGTIYELRDALGFCAELFAIGGKWILLGPFVEKEWNAGECEGRLAELGIPVSYLNAYKACYCRLYVCPSSDMLRTAEAAICSVINGTDSYRIEILEAYPHIPSRESPLYVENTNNAAEHYELENAFMECIRNGDEKGAIACFRQQNELPHNLIFMKYIDRRNLTTGPTVFRTLIRKAAESAGLSPVTVDAISQSYAQKMYLSSSRMKNYRLLEEMIAEICTEVSAFQKNNYSPHIRSAVQYIQLHLDGSLKLEQVADQTGISVSYLSRIFRAETGMSVIQYVTEQRLLKAVRFLTSTRISIQDISYYVGYPDSNYFVKVFRQKYHMTPSEYRKRYS